MINSLETKRWVRSLITTCAASVQVTDKRRQSVGDFIQSALNNIPTVWNEFTGGKLVYFVHDTTFALDLVNPEVVDALNGVDHLNFDEGLTEKTLAYVNFVSRKWFSVPDDELSYDLTNQDVALQHILIGNALALLPWRPDNTFEIQTHGLQLLPGVYEIPVREMYVFDKVQFGAQGPYNAIGAIVTYRLTIIEGKISGHRKGGGRKPYNIKIDSNVNLKVATKVKSKKKDRGISL